MNIERKNKWKMRQESLPPHLTKTFRNFLVIFSSILTIRKALLLFIYVEWKIFSPQWDFTVICSFLRTQEDTLTHTLQFSSLQGAHKCSSHANEASISLKEAKLLIAQSLISDTQEDSPHKIKLKNKGIEASLCTSLQLSAAVCTPFSHAISAATG